MQTLLISLGLVLLISCGDDGPNCPEEHILPIVISPYKPFYNIGDTIAISSKFYKMVYDKKTDRYYDASKYNFSPDVSFFSVDSTVTNLLGSQVHEYSNYIKLDSSKMNVIYSGNQSAIVGQYNLRYDTLFFEVKLKLQKAGYFWVSTESLSSGDGHLQNNYMFNCRGREIIFNLVAPQENNIKLLQKFRTLEPNDWILSDSISRFYNYAGYCFEVR